MKKEDIFVMQELQMFVYFAVSCDGTELSQVG